MSSEKKTIPINPDSTLSKEDNDKFIAQIEDTNKKISKMEKKEEPKIEIDDLKEYKVENIVLEMKNIKLSEMVVTYIPPQNDEVTPLLMTLYPDLDPNIVTYTVILSRGNFEIADSYLNNLTLNITTIANKVCSSEDILSKVREVYLLVFEKKLANNKETIGKAIFKLCKYDPSLIIFFVQLQCEHSVDDQIQLTTTSKSMTKIQEKIHSLKMEIEFYLKICHIKQTLNISFLQARTLFTQNDLCCMTAINKYMAEHFD